MEFLLRNTPSSAVPLRARLTVDREGTMLLANTELEELNTSEVRWAETVVNSEDPFLYHKTTHRPLHRLELNRAREEGYVEAIFRNERDEVTEGTFSNVWILKEGVYFTPPVLSGLLNGTYRQYLLAQENFPSAEKVLRKEDVDQADAIFISNAIRGLLQVYLR